MTKLDLERILQWKLPHEEYVHFLLSGNLPDGSLLEDHLVLEEQQGMMQQFGDQYRGGQQDQEPQMDQQQRQMMGGQFDEGQQPSQFGQDGMPGQEDQFQSSEEQDGESSFPPTEQA
jgi:hypothetical protein